MMSLLALVPLLAGPGRTACAAPIPANMLIEIRKGATVSPPFAAVDLSKVKEPSPALKAFLAAFDASKPVPPAELIVRDESLLARWSRTGDATEVYADLRPPEAGGMLRARYATETLGRAGRAKRYFIAKALYDLGFSVALEENLVIGLVDGDHQALPRELMVASFTRFVRAAQRLGGFESELPALLSGDPPQLEASRRIDGAVRAVLGDGSSFDDALGGLGPGEVVVRAESVGAKGEGPIEAAITYDLDRALRDRAVYVTPYAETVAGFEKLRAVVFTVGGPDTLTALAARRAGTVAFLAASSTWTRSRGLLLHAGTRSVLLREGARVRLDPKSGDLTVLGAR